MALWPEYTDLAQLLAGTNFVINANGEFRYSGPPAAGNLAFSDTNSSGTDGFGNAYLAGLTQYSTYGGGVFALQENGASFNVWTAATQAGPWVQGAAGIAFNAPNVVLLTGSLIQIGNAGSVTQVNGAIQSIFGTAANPTLITTDSTHGLGALGVANLSITTANFTLLPDGGCFISVKGSATGAVPGGSTAFPNSLPAQYTPATTTLLPAMYGGVIAAGENRPRLIVGASGQVTLVYPTLANGNTVSAGGRYDLQ